MGKRISLFVDAHCLSSEFQGLQTFITGLYKKLLLNADIEFHFGCYDKALVLEKIPAAHDCRFLIYKKAFLPLQRLWFDIPRYLRKNKIDFAHFQNIVPFTNTGTRYIVTLHDLLILDEKGMFPFFYRKTRQSLFRRSFLKSTIKTTVSEYSRERINHWYKIEEKEISIIPNGIADPEDIGGEKASEHIYSKYGISDFILYVSRIEPRKNHLLLIRSFLELYPNIKDKKLVCIGKASLRTKAILKKFDNNKIIWLEQVDQYSLNCFYRACCLFVYPSLAEGFGLPPLEAAVHSCPVICSNKTAMKHYNFFHPYQFEPTDARDLVHKIMKMIASPPQQDYLSNVKESILNKYSWEKSAVNFISLINKYTA